MVAGFPGAHPRDRSTSLGLLAPSPLPIPLTPLVGRTHELETLERLYRDPAVRLITITGVGGVGKTRVALEFALRQQTELDGRCWFVSLATLNDPAAVEREVGQALGLLDLPGAETGERLRLALGDDPALIVLDNFEHLRDAGPVIVRLLQAVPGLKLLVTSREALLLRGERQLPVRPLSLPDESGDPAAAIATSDAVRLFVERYAAVRGDFTLTEDNADTVAAICRRLDGIPLALELAAARGRVLPLGALADRLRHRLPLLTGGARDLPDRQRTMRDAIAWSYDLLTDGERAFLRRLSPFEGGVALDAARSVALDGDASEDDALGVIGSLVDKHLLTTNLRVADELRYDVLGVVREFGLEQLEAAGELESTADRHAQWFGGLARASFRPLFYEPLSFQWLDRIDRERANLETAFRWLVGKARPREALVMALDLTPFWYYRSYRNFGVRLLHEAVQAAGALEGELRARASFSLGFLLESRPEAEPYLQESAAIWRELDRPVELAITDYQLGYQSVAIGDFDTALTRIESVVPRLFDLGLWVWAEDSLIMLGQAEYGLGHLDRAFARCQEARAAIERTSDPYSRTKVSLLEGLIEIDRGHAEAARAALLQAVETVLEVGNREWLMVGVGATAVFAARQRHPEQAARLLGAMEHLAETIGFRVREPERPRFTSARAEVQLALEPAVYAAAFASGTRMSVEDVIGEIHANLAPGIASVEATSAAGGAFGLTNREREVLGLVAQGLSDRAIGQQLSISTTTVSRHVANIFNKMDVSTRTAAAYVAIRHGLV